jgi:hypothetical protein
MIRIELHRESANFLWQKFRTMVTDIILSDFPEIENCLTEVPEKVWSMLKDLLYQKTGIEIFLVGSHQLSVSLKNFIHEIPRVINRETFFKNIRVGFS